VIPLSWRIGILAGSVAGLIALGWQVNRWRTEAGRVDAMEREVAQAKKEAKDARSEQVGSVLRNYRLEIGRGADLGPPPVVRLCSPAITLPADPAGTAEASPGPVPLPDVPTRDIGGDLDALMREADRVSAQLRAVLELVDPKPADVF
jgi:hypothetical protein